MKTKHWILIGAGALAGAVIACWLLRGDRSEKPPKGAPQTPLNNPGDQSEFRSAPGEEGLM